MIVQEVAQAANLSVREVNRLIKEGILKATFNMALKRSEVTEADFNHWQANRRGRGRPKQEN